MYIENENLHSYTLPVYRNQNSNSLENLVVMVYSSGKTKTFLINYNKTYEELNSMNLQQIQQNNVDYSLIDFDTNSILLNNNTTAKNNLICIESYSYEYGVPCHDGELTGGENFCYGWVLESTSCFSMGGDDGGTYPSDSEPSSTPSNPESGSSSNNSSNEEENNEIITTPVHCPGGCLEIDEEVENLAANPCKKISKQLTKFSTMRQELVNLATTTSQSNENGIQALSGYTGAEADAIQNVPPGSSTAVEFDINPPTPYVMIAHTHNSPANSTYSVFSWDDLTVISLLLYKNQINVKEFVFYVITADGTRYALTINDKVKFMQYIFDWKKMPQGTVIPFDRVEEKGKIEREYYSKEFNNIPLIKENSNPDDDKVNFLKLMKKADIGADLFEVNATFTTYTKLTLDSNNNLKQEPCQ